MKRRYLLVLLTTLTLGATVALTAENDKNAAPVVGVPAGYPLNKCPVSGETLGEMGKPVKATHEGTDVYLCCKSCLKDFNKDPAKYTQMVKDASGKKS